MLRQNYWGISAFSTKKIPRSTRHSKNRFGGERRNPARRPLVIAPIHEASSINLGPYDVFVLLRPIHDMYIPAPCGCPEGSRSCGIDRARPQRVQFSMSWVAPEDLPMQLIDTLEERCVCIHIYIYIYISLSLSLALSTCCI